MSPVCSDKVMIRWWKSLVSVKVLCKVTYLSAFHYSVNWLNMALLPIRYKICALQRPLTGHFFKAFLLITNRGPQSFIFTYPGHWHDWTRQRLVQKGGTVVFRLFDWAKGIGLFTTTTESLQSDLTMVILFMCSLETFFEMSSQDYNPQTEGWFSSLLCLCTDFCWITFSNDHNESSRLKK